MEPSPIHQGNSNADTDTGTGDAPEVVGLGNGELKADGGEFVRVDGNILNTYTFRWLM